MKIFIEKIANRVLRNDRSLEPHLLYKRCTFDAINSLKNLKERRSLLVSRELPQTSDIFRG